MKKARPDLFKRFEKIAKVDERLGLNSMPKSTSTKTKIVDGKIELQENAEPTDSANPDVLAKFPEIAEQQEKFKQGALSMRKQFPDSDTYERSMSTSKEEHREEIKTLKFHSTSTVSFQIACPSGDPRLSNQPYGRGLPIFT